MKKMLPALLCLLVLQFSRQPFAMAQNRPLAPVSKTTTQKPVTRSLSKPAPGRGAQYEIWYPVFQGLNFTAPAFIDKTGKPVLSFDSSYTLLEHGNPGDNVFDGECMIVVKQGKVFTDNQYFVTDRKGNLKAIPTGIYVNYFCNGRILLQQNRRWAIWKTDGTPLTPFKYDIIYPYSEGFATAVLKDSFTLIDENGAETVPLQPRISTGSKGGRETFNIKISEGLTSYAGNGKFGVMDKKANKLTPPVFDWLDPFHNDLAFARKNDTSGFINRNGAFVFTFDRKIQNIPVFNSGLALVCNEFRKSYSYINTSGKTALTGIYLSASDFSNGYAVVKASDTAKKQQIIDTHGKVMYEGFFENAWFGPDLIMLFEPDLGNNAVGKNNYKWLNYNFQPVWQPPAAKRLITNINGIPETDWAEVKFASFSGFDDRRYALKDVEPFLNKANLVTLRMNLKDRSFAFPPAILQMTNLEELDLSSSAVTDLPDNIGQLQNLKVLKLNYTSIKRLPESLYQLKQLQTISLANTQLTMEAIMAFKQKMPGVKVILKDE